MATFEYRFSRELQTKTEKFKKYCFMNAVGMSSARDKEILNETSKKLVASFDSTAVTLLAATYRKLCDRSPL